MRHSSAKSLARLLLGLAIAATSTNAALADDAWEAQRSGTEARLRGLCVVSARVAWASGAQGTVVRTTDAGASWLARIVPGAEALDFRDVHADSDRVAQILSIGPGALSRIYRTTDGGETWSLRFRSDNPRMFLDAFAFWDPTHGIAVGDPIDGHFTILRTDDAGETWAALPADGMPAALAGEGAFAASGTCITVSGTRDAWFGTGGAAVSRVFRSTDRGQRWTAHRTPIAADKASSGIFSLSFRDASNGVAIGGDYSQPELAGPFVAVTRDGGQSWTLPQARRPAGFRSAVAFIPGSEPAAVVAVGPSGTDLSRDGGATWTSLGAAGFHAVGLAQGEAAGWAVGEAGAIARLRRP